MERSYEQAKDILSAMKTRYSCRSFSDQPIPDETLNDILETGLQSADGGNLQPYSIIVVRDPAKKEILYEACAKQNFIRQAPVNLVFLMDWHKFGVYAKQQKAPFVAHRSFIHFLISMEDVMCTAQTIESAAYLSGIGSCYVGSIINEAQTVRDALNLPSRTYPVLVLSMGYPAHDVTNRVRKLNRSVMVFHETYPDLSDDDIKDAYEEKYADMTMSLPKTEPYRSDALERFRCALETTYSPEEAKEILCEVDKAGSMNETQRRFGLHYRADQMLEISKSIFDDLKFMGMDITDNEKLSRTKE